MLYDTHMHTRFSGDSDAAPEDMIKAAREKGLTGLCFTDHLDIDYREEPHLFDLDFEKYPEQHCVKVKEILESERDSFPAISDELIHAIQSHGWKLCCDVEPVTRMEKVLYTIDELTGLIFACAMARPSKSVMDMELKSVTKKFKTPAFAAGCNRDVIKEGAHMLGMELNDVILRCLEGMRSRHEELGV